MLNSGENLVPSDSAKIPEQPKAADAASFRLFLQNELIRRCEKNPAYSLRGFARTLGCDVATLSKMLKGKRGIGRITILNLGTRLGLSPQEIEEFINKRQKGKRAINKRHDASLIDYQQLTLDSFKVISDWYHYGILELMRVDHFKPDPKWIARTLGLTVSEVNIAVERLVRVDLLEITPEGKWKDLTGGTSTTTGNPFTAAAFKKLQRQVLEKAITAIDEVPMEERDQSSVTMAIDSSLLPEAKERIKLFRRDLGKFLSKGEKRDSVYQLGISLYPLTKNVSEEIEET